MLSKQLSENIFNDLVSRGQKWNKTDAWEDSLTNF